MVVHALWHEAKLAGRAAPKTTDLLGLLVWASATRDFWPFLQDAMPKLHAENKPVEVRCRQLGCVTHVTPTDGRFDHNGLYQCDSLSDWVPTGELCASCLLRGLLRGALLQVHRTYMLASTLGTSHAGFSFLSLLQQQVCVAETTRVYATTVCSLCSPAVPNFYG